VAAIIIRVGASLDRSVSTVFAQLSDLSRKAAKAADGASQSSNAAQSKAIRGRLTEEEKAYKASEQAARKAEKEKVRAAEAASREIEREFEKGERAKTREMEKEVRKRAAISRQEAKDAEENASKVAKAQMAAGNARAATYASMRSGAIGLAGRAAMGVGRMGLSVAGEIASGMGVNLDAGSHFANASSLNQTAVNLSNAGYMPNDKGANGQRVDPRELQNQAYEIGNQTGTSANDVGEAMRVMVGKTGDLQATRDTMAELAKLSKASGTSLLDMADAAGDVSNQLGDIPDKGKVINEVMRSIAGQGKLGAVEIKDLASQMAKVAAGAQQIEGDAAENIKLLGAFAQEARHSGGAASASQAATSVQGMMTIFRTPRRMEEFRKNGIETTTKSGMIRNPEEILIQALQKKGMDVAGFQKMFANTSGSRAVAGFANIYRKAYSTTSGTNDEKMAAATSAVRQEFERLKNVAMSTAELQESFNRSMETGQSNATIFNNHIQKAADQLQTSLLPALIALSPVVIGLADKFTALIAKVLPPDTEKDDAAASTGARKDHDVVSKMLNHADTMTEGDYSMANELLQKRGSKLDKAIENKQADVDESKKGLGIGDLVAGFVGQTVQDVQSGNYAKALNLGGEAGRGAGVIKSGRNAKGAMAADAIAEMTAQKRQIEEQTSTLRELHSIFKSGTINVNVVNKPGGNTGKAPPNAAGAQNNGLEPTG
jgi:hypothetical protein